ncbi:MAG: class I SAM-dependent methyltransferase [Acidobacteriota bacterium]
MMDGDLVEERRARARQLAEEFSDRGDNVGWFEAFYREAGGDNGQIPWADLEPNRFFRIWAEEIGLKGNGRTALVVGCGLGDDAKYLNDLGFEVTAFDISPTAIEWAKRLHNETNIQFVVADLFEPPSPWLKSKNTGDSDGGTDNSGAFDFVLEVYTIQPLPLEMRSLVIDAIAAFVSSEGELVVVTRGREDDEEPDQLPWPLSRKDLSRFETHGLVQKDFRIIEGDEDPPLPRFVVQYRKGV